jgi:hypothetical protein
MSPSELRVPVGSPTREEYDKGYEDEHKKYFRVSFNQIDEGDKDVKYRR